MYVCMHLMDRGKKLASGGGMTSSKLRIKPKKSTLHSGSKIPLAQEFKKWLKKFDTNKDGRISKGELREAIRANGHWFSWTRSYRGIKVADANGDGFIDEKEFKNLTEFAQRNLGVRII